MQFNSSTFFPFRHHYLDLFRFRFLTWQVSQLSSRPFPLSLSVFSCWSFSLSAFLSVLSFSYLGVKLSSVIVDLNQNSFFVAYGLCASIKIIPILTPPVIENKTCFWVPINSQQIFDETLFFRLT